MYKFLPVALLILCSFSTQAQSNQLVDSLLKALDNASADTSRMKLYRRIGNYYTDNNAGKAIGYLEQSMAIAKKLNLALPVANDHYNIAFCYLLKSDFKQSLYHYFQSVRIYEQLKDSFRLGNAFMSIGNLYSQNKDFKKTLSYYDKAQQLIEAQKDSAQLISLLAQRGILYDQLHHYDTAISYLQQALQLARASKDDFMITNTLANLGLSYKHENNTARALACFDSVLVFYQSMDVPVDSYAALYNNIAATHSQAGNYALAKRAFDTSISYAQKAGTPFLEMENYTNLADMYGKMKQFELQSTYLKKYYNIKDSLFTADNKNQLTQLEADYQIEKRNHEIVKKDAEVHRQKSQRNTFILIALAAAVLLTTLLFFYGRIRRNNGLLVQKK